MGRYTVARRSAEDDEALFGIYQTIFGQARTEASRRRWRWQYLDNPNAPTPPAVWVVREGSEPLGQMGTMPVRLWWGDREVLASWGMDYFVKPESEGRGLGPLLARAWAAEVEVALAMGLTPPAYAVYKRLGFVDVGEVPFLQALVDPTAVARRRLGTMAGSLVGPALRGGLALVRWARGGGRQDPELAVRPLRELGPELDDLWRRVRDSHGVCVRRDATYLRWKYLDCPHRDYDLLQVRRGEELAGFAVSRTEDHQGLKLGWVVDVFTDAADSAAQGALLGAVMESFRRSGVARAQASCSSAALERQLRRQGFFSGVSRSLFCVAARAGMPEAVRDPGGWHVVFGDGDTDR